MPFRGSGTRHTLEPCNDLAKAGAPDPPSPSTTTALLELPAGAMVLCTTAPAVVRGVLPWLDPELQIGASSRRLGTVAPRQLASKCSRDVCTPSAERAKSSGVSAVSTAVCPAGKPRPCRPTGVVTKGIPRDMAMTFLVAIPVPLKTGATKTLSCESCRFSWTSVRVPRMVTWPSCTALLMAPSSLTWLSHPGPTRYRCPMPPDCSAAFPLGELRAMSGCTSWTSHCMAFTASPCMPPT
eukprot:scaffold57739_cov78-Phaeocystis_antarctica.AAC.3